MTTPSIRKYDKIQLILKTAERCNLACPYCYYFYGGDESYKERPALISQETVESLAEFCRAGCVDMEIPVIEIVFHGGEPMLQKVRRFDQMCATLRGTIEPDAELILGMQSNGTLISDGWLDVLSKHEVRLSISIDGTPDQHDKNRFDHFGRGSHERIVEGLQRARKYSKRNDLLEVGVISVLNAEFDYKEVLDHLIGSLGFSHLSFLLPDCTRDSGIPDGYTAEDYGRVLCDIFDEWVKRPGTSVREIDNILQRFQLAKYSDLAEQRREVRIHGDVSHSRNQIVIVQSNGDLSIDDALIPVTKWQNQKKDHNVRSTSLSEFLGLPIYDELEIAYTDTPDNCVDCCWQPLCNGGDLENRYSSAADFNNSSVFCAGLKKFYERIVTFLYESGYPEELIYDRLTRPFAEQENTFLL